MISVDEEENINVMLCAADFPHEYVNMQHPEDYTLHDSPITPSFIVNQRQGHTRLIFRISWRAGSKFMPMSFIVDTGAVHPIYFGNVGMRMMEAHRLLFLDDLGNDVVKLQSPGTECSIHYKATPKCCDPANIVGLRFLLRFGLVLEASSFHFNEHFAHF
jgi:hypothetical protein